MIEYIDSCQFVIYGLPKTKSNHSLVNKKGKKILPKNSPYALYEKEIVNSILDQVGEVQFKGKIICVLNVFFKHRDRHPDLNNMPKSICDGIEKSNIILNDRDIVNVYLTEEYDYDNPRVEVALYDANIFKPVHKIVKRSKREISELEEEIKLKEKEKRKRVTKKNAEKNSGLICSICKKGTDLDHSKAINGKKERVCLRCILVGC